MLLPVPAKRVCAKAGVHGGGRFARDGFQSNSRVDRSLPCVAAPKPSLDATRCDAASFFGEKEGFAEDQARDAIAGKDCTVCQPLCRWRIDHRRRRAGWRRDDACLLASLPYLLLACFTCLLACWLAGWRWCWRWRTNPCRGEERGGQGAEVGR